MDKFMSGLRESVKVVGINRVAKLSGLCERYLFTFVKPDSRPGFETVYRICKALKIKNIEIK